MRRTTICPQCGTRYQVEPALQGRRMRCPRSDCGEVFVVVLEKAISPEPEGPQVSPTLPAGTQQTGHVEQILPILPTELIAPAETEETPPFPSSSPNAMTASPPPAPPGEASPATPPLQVCDWHFQGPPPLPGEQHKKEIPSPLLPAPPRHPSQKKRWLWLLGLGLFIFLGSGVGLYFWLREQVQESGEEERWQRAWSTYREGNYADAAHEFRELERDYPHSRRHRQYALLAELSECLEPTLRLQSTATEAQQNLEHLEQFWQHHQAEPLLAEHRSELAQGFARLVEQLAALASEKHDAHLLSLAERALAGLQKLPVPPGDLGSRLDQLGKEVQEARQAVTRWRQRQTLLARLHQLAEQPPANPVRQAKTLLEQFPADLTKDPEVQNWLRRLPDIHRKQVKYISISAPPVPLPQEHEDDANLAVTHRLIGAGVTAKPAGAVVVAAVHGLLYACDAATGQVCWVRRSANLGQGLPLYLPAEPLAPERLLVWSEDGRALEAVAARSGQRIWRHPLSGSGPGRPFLAQGRLWLPYASGRLEELAPLTGRCLGYFLLGEPLFPAAAWREGTAWCYLPADGFCVYVLDLDQHTCPAILYTHHPPHALRAPPLVVHGAPAESAPLPPQEGYLILTQAESLDSAALQVWPLAASQVQQLTPAKVWHFPGWPGGPLWHTAEQLAVVSDAGFFALYGMRQPGNADPPVFPQVQVRLPLRGKSYSPDRPLLVAADGQSFWILQQGQLQCWCRGFSEQKGPQLVPVWPQSLSVGQPSYSVAAQPALPGQETILYLATRQPDEQRALFSAVAATRGRLLWQQQLGLWCTPPLYLLGHKVLAWDRGRRLFLFEPGKEQQLHPGWARAGQLLLNTSRRAFLFLSREKETVYVLSEEQSGPPATYTLYQVLLAEPAVVSSASLTIPAPVVGTPALGPDGLILPLANGILLRQPVSGEPASAGPNWRSAPDEEEPRGAHVVWLGGAEYLVSDGGRCLRHLVWPVGRNAEEVAVATLDEPLQVAPLILPGPEATEPLIACAGSRSVTLLAGRELRPRQRWSLPGPLTAGPICCGEGLLCLVRYHQLVCLKPEKTEPVWSYSASAPLVDMPTQFGKSLLVAQVDGSILALDLATGTPQGPVYRPLAPVAPTASPVPWPGERLFVPLSDGTILLLSVARLQR